MSNVTNPIENRFGVDGTKSSASPDLTGRDRMLYNVLTGWGSQLVLIVSGFIVPRLIDSRIGQESLGVWDFGWSVVAYFSFVTVGIVSSINCFVAGQRARGDTDGANRVVSSVSCVLAIMAAIVAALTIGVVLALPHLLSERLGAHVRDAQWLVLFLGLSVSVLVACCGMQGTLTGCHRYDVYNGVEAGMMGVTLIGTLLVLYFGGGLPHLGAVVLLGRILWAGAICSMAYRLFPWLSIRLRYASWSTAKSMLAFGGKTFLPVMGEIVMKATTGVLVISFLGPAALALYSRPMSLIRIARIIVSKFAFLLTPAASSLQAMNRPEDIRDLLVKGMHYGAFIALPMLMGLAILGGPLLRFWMGPNYAGGAIPLILAFGSAAFIVQLPAISVLRGVHAHGRPGLANLIASLCSIVMMYVFLRAMQWGLVGVAIAVVLPSTLVNVFYVSRYAFGHLKMPLWPSLYRAFSTPVLCMVPFSLVLAGARLFLRDRPLAALAWGVGSGGAVLCVLYWRFALSRSLKARILKAVAIKSPPADSMHIDAASPRTAHNADEHA